METTKDTELTTEAPPVKLSDGLGFTLNYRWWDEIRWWKFACYLLSRKFRTQLKYTLFYALNHYDDKRGDGSSDTLLFEAHYGYELIKHIQRKA